jgi:proteasome accessory factor C
MLTETKTHRILRLILLLSNSYPKTKEECIDFLEIKSSAFYNYCNLLKDIGFDFRQKEGKYWIDYSEKDHQVIGNLLHFTEEEAWLLSLSIDSLEEKPGCAAKLKQKLVSFLNHDNAIDAYVHKEKSAITQALLKAQRTKKQILLINYASGNSQTVKNRMVEPFEFKDDFNLVWAFDNELQKNRQFKICRIQDVSETSFTWEHERLHRSLPVDIFRNTGELDKQVEFRLNLRAKNLLIEEYPLAEKYLTAITRNQYIFKVHVAKYEGPGRFVLGIAEDIQLVGDAGFLEFIKQKINKCKQSFGNSANSGVSV